MLKTLKEEVLQANKALHNHGLAILTWGNVSGYDPQSGLIVIKGSGIDYDQMTVGDLAVVDLEGKTAEGKIVPSTDLDTHLELYRHFPTVRGVAHTHSGYATIWAQAERDIPCLGTTHADYFKGAIPCTRAMTDEEIQGQYELNTGKVIIEHFQGVDPMQMRAVLVRGHGPFTWGASATDALHISIILEEVAKLAFRVELLQGDRAQTLDPRLCQRHYDRKFGANAYYGQCARGDKR